MYYIKILQGKNNNYRFFNSSTAIVVPELTIFRKSKNEEKNDCHQK